MGLARDGREQRTTEEAEEFGGSFLAARAAPRMRGQRRPSPKQIAY